MKIRKRSKRSVINSLAERSARRSVEKEKTKFPFLVERRLKGYNTATVLFLFLGIAALIATKSVYALFLGIFLAGSTFLLGFMQRRQVAKNGYENWRFIVIEYTKLTALNRTPTGFYAESIDGPYKGNICHIALSGASVTPPEGQTIELCVPGDTKASLIRDVYYIPQYYGMSFVGPDE